MSPATKSNKPVIAIIRELREDDTFIESSDFYHDFTEGGEGGAEKTVRTVGFRTKVIIVSEDSRNRSVQELKEDHSEALFVAGEIGGKVARLLEIPTQKGSKRYELVEFLPGV